MRKKQKASLEEAKSRKKALLMSLQVNKIRNLIDMYKNMWGELSKHQRKNTLENLKETNSYLSSSIKDIVFRGSQHVKGNLL